MSAIPQVILLRQAKSLSASISSFRGVSSGSLSAKSAPDETIMVVKDPPRVRGCSPGSDEEDVSEYRSYRLSIKATREEFTREEDSPLLSTGKLAKSSGPDSPKSLCEKPSKDQEKSASLMNLDPECWVQLAESGMYQRAEDCLAEAANM
jgi:hypothetical protein